jgi:GT2 family glycosyltransferase
MMPELSFVIPSWNAKKYLKRCIESIIINSGTYDREIIVVDNASTDGSVELIEKQFNNVKLISNDVNLGFARACNIGLTKSRGRYIILMNSDVEITKDSIERMVSFIDRHSDIGMLGPKIIGPNGNLQRSCMGFPTVWNTFCRALALDSLFPGSKLFGRYLMTFWPHDSICDVDVINGCFWMVRREALTQVGLLDERYFIYAEDTDWCRRFWDAGWKVVYYPEAQAIHYGGASSSNAPVRFYIEMLKANLQYWQKYHNRPGRMSFLVIMGLHHVIRLIGESLRFIIKPEKRLTAKFKIRRSISSLKWIVKNN